MNSLRMAAPWRRMIAFVHVDSFGLAVEQAENPGLAGRPVVLLHSDALPRLVEASPEARALGLRTGMEWETASAGCPGLGRLPARPAHYAAVSARLWEALASISPDLEPFAAGAAFLDLTACQAYYRHDPRYIAGLMQEALAAAGAPAATVAIAADKTTARIAAQGAAPGAVTVIAPGDAAAVLAPLPLSRLCGDSPLLAAFFAGHGVADCGGLARLPVAVVAQRFGNHGRRLWLMAQGLDPDPVRPRREEARSPLLGRLLPPGPTTEEALLGAFRALCGKLGQRLAREGWQAQELRIGLRAPEGWRREWTVLPAPAQDDLFAPCRRFLRRHWFGEEVRQVDLLPAPESIAFRQEDIFRGARGGRGRTVRS
jgi:DNA polymerase-4